MPATKRDQVSEKLSQESNLSSESGHGDMKALLKQMWDGAEKKVKKKQVDFLSHITSEGEEWDDRWAEVATRHEGAMNDLYQEFKISHEANQKEQDLVVQQILDKEAEAVKLVAKFQRLMSTLKASHSAETSKLHKQLESLFEAERYFYETALVAVADGDRRTTFGEDVEEGDGDEDMT